MTNPAVRISSWSMMAHAIVWASFTKRRSRCGPCARSGFSTEKNSSTLPFGKVKVCFDSLQRGSSSVMPAMTLKSRMAPFSNCG